MAEEMDSFPLPMLVAQTALNAVSDPVPLGNSRKHWHSAVFGAGVSAGTVIVETANDRNYAGTWEVIATLASGGAPSSQGANVSYEGPLGFVRHRISVAIVGGTVSTFTRRLRTQ